MITFLLIWIAIIQLVQFIYSETFNVGLMSIRNTIEEYKFHKKLKRVWKKEGRVTACRIYKSTYPDKSLREVVDFCKNLCRNIKPNEL